MQKINSTIIAITLLGYLNMREIRWIRYDVSRSISAKRMGYMRAYLNDLRIASVIDKSTIEVTGFKAEKQFYVFFYCYLSFETQWIKEKDPASFQSCQFKITKMQRVCLQIWGIITVQSFFWVVRIDYNHQPPMLLFPLKYGYTDEFVFKNIDIAGKLATE